MRSLFVPILFTLILFFGALKGFGAQMDGQLDGQLDGVTFPDSLELAHKPLVLNGLGLRLATFLKIKVYVAGLYLEKKSSDPATILASPELKHIEMVFVRGVGAGKLRDAWPDDLHSNCNSGCDAFLPPVQKLQSLMVDMNSGDHMGFDFYPDRVDVQIKGKLVGTLAGPGFSSQLLKDWIGNPGNPEIKEGLLGGNEATKR